MLRRLSLLVPFVTFASAVSAQTAVLTCQTSAVPQAVRSEGISERTGDMLISCSGGQPGAQISGNMIVSLNVTVTNHILPDQTLDAYLTISNGASTTMPALLYTNNAVAFNGVIFNVGADGKAEFRIVNLRGNASQLGVANENPIVATVSFTGAGIAVPNSVFTVAVPQRGLLASTTGQLICDVYGSSVPDPITLAGLYSKGTSYTTTRVTEGFASAFAPASDPASYKADAGIRIISRYTSMPADARLFIPNAVAGSSADAPTSSGDLGVPGSGGKYTPGKNELLLIRVVGADANGAGGTLAIRVPTGPATFDSVAELTPANGTAYAVYEVVDANPFVRESAQFPTFLGLPANPNRGTIDTGFSVNFAAISNVVTPSSTAWIPRFIETAAPLDCTALGDCNANYFPRLQVDTGALQITAAAGNAATRYLPLRNVGSGVLRWNITVNYAQGSNWLRLSPAQGVNNGTVRIDAVTTGLQPGDYHANLILDAGVFAGTKTIPVTLTVVAPGQSTGQTPVISSVTSAASGTVQKLVAGSLATIIGSHLAGQSVQVTFDGTPASLLYKSDQQINVMVPAALADKQTAKVQVIVDGLSSAMSDVSLVAAAPAIFPGAVLNEDYTPNSETAPASTGTVLQIFATGLPANGPITARIHDRDVPVPQYGGPAPGLDGVQQVNIGIPPDLPTMQTYVYVCGGASADQQVCSPATKVWLAHQQ